MGEKKEVKEEESWKKDNRKRNKTVKVEDRDGGRRKEEQREGKHTEKEKDIKGKRDRIKRESWVKEREEEKEKFQEKKIEKGNGRELQERRIIIVSRVQRRKRIFEE